MYIDPLTLFIIAEFFVVYVIINVFLFYKSRLLKVLLALLKEMRFEKLRRQQEKQNALALERQKNSSPRQHKSTPESQPETPTSQGEVPSSQGEIARQLEIHKASHPQDLTNALELDQPEQWLRIRFLELEQELIEDNIDERTWKDLAVDAINRLQTESAEFEELAEVRKDEAEQERYTGQLETDLQESENKLTEAMIRIRQLEAELEEIRSISTPGDSLFETPAQGKYEDQLYQLKCANFDLNETINKLKLDMQQMDPGSQSEAYTELLERQIENLEQYIKSADISNGLLEKEVAAAQATISQLESQQGHKEDLISNPNTSDHNTNNSDSLKPLHKQQQDQADVVDILKNNLKKLQSGENEEALLNEQAEQIARLEQILKESKQCITILESELDQSHKDVDELESKLSKNKSEKLANKLNELSDVRTGQKSSLGELRNIVTEIQQGGDSDELIEQHQKQIDRLEGYLAESDTLISQLETEINELTHKLDEAEKSAAHPATEPENSSNENLAEMETLLRQYMSDTQSLLTTTSRLEEENIKLKERLDNHSTEATETIIDFEDEPPVITDVEMVENSKSDA
jgi:uncharacterized coiled-coil protein SlyX